MSLAGALAAESPDQRPMAKALADCFQDDCISQSELPRMACIIVSPNQLSMYSVASRAISSAAHSSANSALNLVLACAAFPSDRQKIRRAIEQPIAWDQFAVLAERHGLLPVVCSLLEPAEIPPEVRNRLRDSASLNSRQALWLTQLLCTIIDLLEERCIPCLPYKGPILAQTLYNDVASRQYSDLDILVRPSDLSHTADALASLGLTSASHLTPAEVKAHLTSGYEQVFDGPKCRNVVEIQWRILPRFYSVSFNLEDFFEQSEQVSIGARTFRTLSCNNLLLVLCVHAAKHAWANLSWIRDIAVLGTSPDIAWQRVLSAASHLGIQRIVGISFRLANQLLGTPLTRELQELVAKDLETERISGRIAKNLIEGIELDLESLEYFQLIARVRERLRDRIVFLSRLALTPTMSEWSTVRLPEPLFPAYRIVRLGRLVRRVLSKS